MASLREGGHRRGVGLGRDSDAADGGGSRPLPDRSLAGPSVLAFPLPGHPGKSDLSSFPESVYVSVHPYIPAGCRVVVAGGGGRLGRGAGTCGERRQIGGAESYVYLRPARPAINSLGLRLRKSSFPPGEIVRGICAYQRQQYGCWL